MSSTSPPEARSVDPAIPDFSLVQQGPLHNAQRAARLLPLGGYGLGRRIGLLILVTWVPLVVWALLNRRAFESVVGEPLLQHFGIHVRFLVAVPLLVIAEPFAEAIGRRIVSYFVTSGLVPERTRPAFTDAVVSTRRLLASRLALAAMLVFAFGSSAVGGYDLLHLHEISWAMSGDRATVQRGFGAWWFLWVSRPIYQVLLLSWLWRLVVTAIMLWRISRLDLHLVPTHPDACGGLAFLEAIPVAFTPVILAVSSVLAARWGHDVLYHGVSVQSLRLSMILLVVLLLVLFLGPLLAFVPRLAALKRRSLLAYGALIGRHGPARRGAVVAGRAGRGRRSAQCAGAGAGGRHAHALPGGGLAPGSPHRQAGDRRGGRGDRGADPAGGGDRDPDQGSAPEPHQGHHVGIREAWSVRESRDAH